MGSVGSEPSDRNQWMDPEKQPLFWDVVDATSGPNSLTFTTGTISNLSLCRVILVDMLQSGIWT
jgi:hypothetical protein